MTLWYHLIPFGSYSTYDYGLGHESGDTDGSSRDMYDINQTTPAQGGQAGNSTPQDGAPLGPPAPPSIPMPDNCTMPYSYASAASDKESILDEYVRIGVITEEDRNRYNYSVNVDANNCSQFTLTRDDTCSDTSQAEIDLVKGWNIFLPGEGWLSPDFEYWEYRNSSLTRVDTASSASLIAYYSGKEETRNFEVIPMTIRVGNTEKSCLPEWDAPVGSFRFMYLRRDLNVSEFTPDQGDTIIRTAYNLTFYQDSKWNGNIQTLVEGTLVASNFQLDL